MKVLYFAFNQACEPAIANARWNNMGKMEQRIIKDQQFINKNAGENHTKYHIVISQEMLDLKLEELRLAHEYEIRKIDLVFKSFKLI